MTIERIRPIHAGQWRKSLQSRNVMMVKTSSATANPADVIPGVTWPRFTL